MSDYKIRFDAHVAAATSAVLNKTTAIRDGHFGMKPDDVRRLLERIGNLLGRVDEKKFEHPEYLSLVSSNVPEKAIELISQMPNSLSDSVESFTKGVLPQLIQVHDLLEKCVGSASYKTKDIKQAQVRALDKILYDSNRKLNEILEQNAGAISAATSIDNIKSRITQVLSQANADGNNVNRISKQAEKLAGGGVRRNPLEDLLSKARAKYSEIEEIANDVGAKSALANNACASAQDNAEDAKKVRIVYAKVMNGQFRYSKTPCRLGLPEHTRSKEINSPINSQNFPIYFTGLLY